MLVIRAPDKNGSFPRIADGGLEIRVPPNGFPVNSETAPFDLAPKSSDCDPGDAKTDIVE